MMKIVVDSTPLAILALREREDLRGTKGRILLRLDPEKMKIIAVEESSLSLLERLFLGFDTRFRLSTIIQHLLSEIEKGAALDEPSLQLLDKKIVRHNASAPADKIEESSKVISLSSRIFHPMTLSCLASDALQAQILHDFLVVSQRPEDFKRGLKLLETLEADQADLELCRSVSFKPKQNKSTDVDSADMYLIDSHGIIRQKADGNCLLTSFATGLSLLLDKSVVSPESLRKEAMNYIEKWHEKDLLLSGYIETAISEFNDDMRRHGLQHEARMKINSIGEYIKRACENHFWCSIPQIYALSKLYHVRIEVYYESEHHTSPFCIIPPSDACVGTVCLSYDGVHYNTYVKEQ